MAVEPNRWGIIYNPKAGSRKTQKRWNEIRSYMENRKVVFPCRSLFPESFVAEPRPFLQGSPA